MTTRRKQWIAATVALIALVGCVVVFARPREPRFEGRSLTYWAARLNQPEAQRALTAIGTNALPFLIDWLDEKPTRFDSWMWRVGQYLPDSLRPNPWPFGSRQDIAAMALGFLGTNAIPAIPKLIQVFEPRWTSAAPPSGLFELSEIGAAAIPALMNILEEKPERGHYVAAMVSYMSQPHRLGPRTTQDLQQIVAALDQIVGGSNGEANLAVADYLSLLVEYEAVRNEVDNLWFKLLRDQAPMVRRAAVEHADSFPPDSPQWNLLLPLRDDPDVDVRAAVERVLKKAGRLGPIPEPVATPSEP